MYGITLEPVRMDADVLFNKVYNCAYTVHATLGPGLLESAYTECLHHELVIDGLTVEKNKAVPIIFKNIKLDTSLQIDLLIEDNLVIVVKSVEALTDLDMTQLMTYLRLAGYTNGIIINFNVIQFRNGFRKISLA